MEERGDREVLGAQDLLGGFAAQARHHVLGAAQGRRQLRAERLHLLERRPGVGAQTALADRAREEPLARGRHHVRADADPARRLADDRDVVGIATELGDVVADPLECHALVHEAVVPGRSVGVREEAERAEAVVHGHDDHAVIMGEDIALGPVLGLQALTEDESAPMDPDHHRRVLRHRVGSVHIHDEAVFVAWERDPERGLRAT